MDIFCTRIIDNMEHLFRFMVIYDALGVDIIEFTRVFDSDVRRRYTTTDDDERRLHDNDG